MVIGKGVRYHDITAQVQGQCVPGLPCFLLYPTAAIISSQANP